MTEHIKYLKEWIKKDMKNTWQYLNEEQKLQLLNSQLERIYNLGVLSEDKALCEIVIKYREEQKNQEEKLFDALTQIFKNRDNLYNHILNEL